ncbi:RNA 2',3'-cyclic phosphodiesterase [Colwelliaceae bacterium 6441]
MKRLFFALDINAKDRHIIREWREQQIQTTFPLTKPVDEENLHITLAFLGAVSDEQQLAFSDFCDQNFSSYEQEKSRYFTLHLTHLKLFNKPKVLYLGFEHFPLPLLSIAETLTKEAKNHGLFQEERDYCPHVSIAHHVKELPSQKSISIPIKVNSFSLYHSQSSPAGVKYNPIHSWSLLKK